MLEINRKLVSGKVRKLLFSVVKWEFNSRHYNIPHCLLWASRTWNRWRVKQSIKIKWADVSGLRLDFGLITTSVRLRLDFGLITTSKNNLSEIHRSRPTPFDSLSVPSHAKTIEIYRPAVLVHMYPGTVKFRKY